jgi:hypothetical protein
VEATSLRRIASAVYGQILVTAVVAALSEDAATTSGYLLLSAGTTVLVLWIAHVYAMAIAQGIHVERKLRGADLRAVALAEAPMIATAIPTLAILLLGVLGVFARNTAVSLAVGAGVVTLVYWGVVFGRTAGESWPSAALSGAMNGGLGMAIVALKAIVD